MNDEVLEKSKTNKYVKLIAGITNITDEEGLKQAYESKDGLHQHYNELFIAGTRDWPSDTIDDLKLPMNDTLNKTTRGRDSDAYYRNHNEIDTVIGHSLGGAVALSLEKQYEKEGNNPYGMIQSKTFGSPTVSGNLSSPNPNRIRWADDPISFMDMNATTVMPSVKQRWRNSAHSYSGLCIKDAVPVHGTTKNMLEQSPDDSQAQAITYQLN